MIWTGRGLRMALVLIIALVAALWWRHDRIEDRIAIISGANPLHCEGTSVVQLPESDRIIDVAVLEPGMRCTLRFQITNDSGYDVTIERIGLPIAGPSGGPGFVATRLSPMIGDVVDLKPEEVDATWPVDDSLAAGETINYEIAIGFRPQGCSALDAITAVDWPHVAVRSWGMSIEVDPETTPVGFLGTEHTNC